MCNTIDRNRRTMTISVIILGIAILTVLLAYIAFATDTTDADIQTLRSAAIVNFFVVVKIQISL